MAQEAAAASEGNNSSSSINIPISAIEAIGSYVISSMNFFEQVDGAPQEIVGAGQQARDFLKKLAEG